MSEGWGANRHITRCTSPVYVVSQCKLVEDQRAAWIWKDFTSLMKGGIKCSLSEIKALTVACGKLSSP